MRSSLAGCWSWTAGKNALPVGRQVRYRWSVLRGSWRFSGRFSAPKTGQTLPGWTTSGKDKIALPVVVFPAGQEGGSEENERCNRFPLSNLISQLRLLCLFFHWSILPGDGEVFRQISCSGIRSNFACLRSPLVGQKCPGIITISGHDNWPDEGKYPSKLSDASAPLCQK